MPENVKSSTTDRHGKVFLLTEKNRWWVIKGTDNVIKAAGDSRYVQNIWSEFVTAEKRAIAANYNGLVGFSIRENRQRP